ncbi:MAG: MlaD family protein, partial [Mycobacterium sp.]|nr:MlaD family protein [Mycobacterium sp.]
MKNSLKTRGGLIALIVALVVLVAGGAYLLWPSRGGHKVVAYFVNAVGLYAGDDVRVLGVPVGTINTVEPQANSVKVTMTLQDGVKIPADARAIIISPNLVAARFIQFTPAYSG